ncbi:MAG: acyl-CoA desaturase [Chloroflexota bacterium]
MTAEVRRDSSHEYAALRSSVRDADLFTRQPWFYIRLGVTILTLLGLSEAILVMPHPFWVYLLDALLLAGVMVQIGFVGHDAAHRQVFSRASHNEMLSILCFNIGMGGSGSWWRDKHNQHHAAPNHDGEDPDIDMNVIAFTPEQARERRGVLRWVVRHQAILFFPLATMVYPTLQLKSAAFLLRRRDRQSAIEMGCWILHYPLFFLPQLIVMSLVQAIVFTVVVEGAVGVYMAASFAPNHKGMPIIESGCRPDFLRAQVETSRNIRRGHVADFLFGSLSAQIEHHLFPTMPRNNLRKAEPLVKAFCARQGIEYYETSTLGSLAEMLKYLHDIGAVAGHREDASIRVKG